MSTSTDVSGRPAPTGHEPTALAADGRVTSAPTIDVAVPVLDEQRALEASITRLHAYLSAGFPFTWRITIVDNGSTDATWAVAGALVERLEGVRRVQLDQKGRGRALRAAWTASDAAVVVYMDVDLSTGLDALLPLVAPLVSGHSDLAIGSRLAAGSNVARGPRREAISRGYNLVLRSLFATRVRDAQCGFKAVRSDIARRLVPEVVDDGWFFDTELLLLAEQNGLRIHEVPVDWVDDPDSRVDVVRTAIGDLRGAARMARRFLTGRGRVELGALARRSLPDDLGRHRVAFVTVGAVSTVVSLALFLALRPRLGAVAAVVVALVATSFGNAWAHRRYTLGQRGAEGLRGHLATSAAISAAGIVASAAALAAIVALGGGLVAELAALAVVWPVVTAVRFALLRPRPPRPASRRSM